MTIFKLVIRRSLMSIVTLLLVSLIIFSMLEVLPGDVASRILGRDATPETLEQLRTELGLDKPAPVRYLTLAWRTGARATWASRWLRAGRFPKSLRRASSTPCCLSAYAFLIYLPLTIVPALLQALNRDRSVDHGFSVMTLVLLSMPDFLLATILLLAFVVMIPLLPAISLVDQSSSAWEYFRAMTLPALTLAIVMAVYAVRMLRDNLIEVLDSDYIRMAELKGLSRRRVSVAPCAAQRAGADAQRHGAEPRLSGRRRRRGREGVLLSGLRQPAGRFACNCATCPSSRRP